MNWINFIKKATDKGIQKEIERIKQALANKRDLLNVVMGVLKDLLEEVSHLCSKQKFYNELTLDEIEEEKKFLLKTPPCFKDGSFSDNSFFLRMAKKEHLEVAKWLDNKVQELMSKLDDIKREHEQWD